MGVYMQDWKFKSSNCPPVTVIVPMRNQEHNLSRLVANLRSQTVRDAQFLLIDDGSTDHTFQKAQELIDGDRRFEVYTKEYTGTGSTRNYGIARARGRYLFFLDADDQIATSRTLETLCEVANRKDVPVCGGSIQFIKRGKVIVPTYAWTPRNERIFDSFLSANALPEEPFEYFLKSGIYSYSEYQYDAGFTRFVFRRDLIQNNGILFPKRRYFEDPVFFTRAMDAANHFAVVPDVVYIYTVGWHPVLHDENYFLETLQGIRENLLFSKERGYKRLHRITCARFRQCNDIDLVLNDSNIVSLRQAARDMWSEFDKKFAEEGSAVEVPRCVYAVEAYKSKEWNSAHARIVRMMRTTCARIVRTVKSLRLMKSLQNLTDA